MVQRRKRGALEGGPRAEGDEVRAAVGDGGAEGHRLEDGCVHQAAAAVLDRPSRHLWHVGARAQTRLQILQIMHMNT